MKEHKLLGTWLDKTGKYGINITKRRDKLQFMIGFIKRHASPRKIGVYSVDARLKLAEVVIIKSILHNAEGFPTYKEDEIKQLESMQLSILTGLLEMPPSTPYCALLMETGWWTMRGRLAYSRMMLYHNILRSEEKRPIRKIILEQEKEERKTTWLNNVLNEINAYNISLDPKKSLKSTWKKEVKTKITERMEKEIRERCCNSTKARIVKNDKYERKEYLKGKASFKDTQEILMTRMNMNKIPGNYKGREQGLCPLCNEGEGIIEHYFECRSVKQVRKAWGVQLRDLTSNDVGRMKYVSKFIEKVEIMIEPKGGKNFFNVLMMNRGVKADNGDVSEKSTKLLCPSWNPLSTR